MKHTKTREAFTMIEFIFVIIIIAILATIAIPRLAATRMDAKLSTKAQNIMTAANEIAAYAVSRGETEANLTEMSGAMQLMVNSGDAVDTNNYRANIKVEESSDCIILRIADPGDANETLRIDYGATNGYCDQLRTLVDADAFPLALRGNIISY
jgi:prepilin-type N-terminal cleavage/methylation domain-containing protein